MNETQTQFAEGLSVYRPGDNAPDFIKANIAIRADEFCHWLQNNKRQDGVVRLTLKESSQRPDGSGGNYYAVLDTFMPTQQGGM